MTGASPSVALTLPTRCSSASGWPRRNSTTAGSIDAQSASWVAEPLK